MVFLLYGFPMDVQPAFYQSDSLPVKTHVWSREGDDPLNCSNGPTAIFAAGSSVETSCRLHESRVSRLGHVKVDLMIFQILIVHRLGNGGIYLDVSCVSLNHFLDIDPRGKYIPRI